MFIFKAFCLTNRKAANEKSLFERERQQFIVVDSTENYVFYKHMTVTSLT